jgi:hypothetical protein
MILSAFVKKTPVKRFPEWKRPGPTPKVRK